jgi:alpha-galactosidase
MNFKIDDKEYDSDKLSDNGKLYLGKLQNINTKEQQLTLEAQDLAILKAKYTELLKAELPKDEVKEEEKSSKES